MYYAQGGLQHLLWICYSFYINIVMHPLINNEPDPKDQVPSFFQGRKVLIVEDDVFLGQILLSSLQKEKADVTLLASGEEAMEYTRTNAPDIMILDIYLPGINGLDFLEKFRKAPLTEKVPVLVVSNTSQEEDRNRASNLSAEFLIKAIATPNDIVERVHDILAKGK